MNDLQEQLWLQSRRIQTKKNFYYYIHSAGHWDFPKGNIEVGEDELETTRREIFEETGIQVVNFLEGFRKKIEYQYTRGETLIQKEVIFHIIRTDTRKIILSNEHIGYVWENYDNAVKKLTYMNAKTF